MAVQLVGAGLGRTGTHTQKIMLEQLLGGTCHHMLEVFAHPDEVPVWHQAALGNMPDWPSFLAGYNAIVDWPGSSYYKELADAFPDAPVLLSIRDVDSWYRSAQNTIFLSIDSPMAQPEWKEMIFAMLHNRFCDDLENEAAMKKAFNDHNDAVRDTIAKDRLIVWEPSDGWEPVCGPLGVPVPDGPVPVTNTTTEFREMIGLPPL